MQKVFDTLIDSFLIDDVGIAENFLTISLATGLKASLLLLFADNKFHLATTGNATIENSDSAIRGDSIYWLDRKNGNTFENTFFDVMDAFVVYLNSTCYTGITGYEFHYTFYQTGSFYKPHLDQFKTNDNRKYSMIMYLNPGWLKESGGELCIHHHKHKQYILPESGKIVFFKSDELLHEVLIATRPRMSITGWLKVGKAN